MRDRRPVVLSYGGGLDSFGGLLDGIERGEKPDVVAFVDVGNGTRDRDGTVPGEWPGTYRHMREIVIPLCEREGIEFVWIDSEHYPVRDAASLFEWLRARRQIPVAGPTRICTVIAKVERFERWLDDRFPDTDVEVWICFEAGEEARAEKDPNAGGSSKVLRGTRSARRHNRFPLIERGLCRCRCEELVRRHGFPIPRKSACKFCPYGSLTDWQRFAREDPEGFALTVEMEAIKPPTKKGKQLSIMGFRTLKDRTGKPIGYRAPPLPLYIQGRPTGRARGPCLVCGRAERATKATGSDYLEPGAAA